MMNVVHITENPIAGAPLNLSRCLNKYQSHKVKSRCIAQSDRNENRVFGADLIIDSTPYPVLKAVLEQADIIHFHNFYQNQHLFRKHPEFWKIVMQKQRVWQVHSPRETAWIRLEDALEDKHMEKLVIGQYHPRQWPECKIVPNVIDIWDERLMPDWSVINEIPRVVYSPSRIGFKGWDNKGFEETVPVLQKFVDDRLITAEVIYDRPYEECLEKRKKADISIDETVTGSYHLCSLESLAAGLITIAGLDEMQISTLKDLTDSSDLPWSVATPKTLESVILGHLIAGKPIRATRKESRAWMEKYWDPKIMTRKFTDIYEAL